MNIKKIKVQKTVTNYIIAMRMISYMLTLERLGVSGNFNIKLLQISLESNVFNFQSCMVNHNVQELKEFW